MEVEEQEMKHQTNLFPFPLSPSLPLSLSFARPLPCMRVHRSSMVAGVHGLVLWYLQATPCQRELWRCCMRGLALGVGARIGQMS